MLLLNWKTVLAAALCMAAGSQLGLAQLPPASILAIDVENLVNYNEDSSDLSKFATDPNVTTATNPRNFWFHLDVGDIVAVNGQPVKGTVNRRGQPFLLSTTPNPGQAIADINRNGVHADTFEILNSDGSPIGSIVAYGLVGGSISPGAPLAVTGPTLAIVGGTGAFLGARGQLGVASGTARNASITEDPANRRRNGGGRTRFVLQVIPMESPQIVVSAGFPQIPLVMHSGDSSLLTAQNPASAGETLRLFVAGLGPTKPGIDSGQPFPASPVAALNSPVTVTVNGKSAAVLAAAGVPGAVGRYYVDFQVPSDTAKGIAAVQVGVAWIQGSAVGIPIQ